MRQWQKSGPRCGCATHWGFPFGHANSRLPPVVAMANMQGSSEGEQFVWRCSFGRARRRLPACRQVRH
eukprot:2446416-Alexandrium_andersonii.AAC.1